MFDWTELVLSVVFAVFRAVNYLRCRIGCFVCVTPQSLYLQALHHPRIALPVDFFLQKNQTVLFLFELYCPYLIRFDNESA